MIACILVSEGGDGEIVGEFVRELEAGIALGEPDALAMRVAFEKRFVAPLPSGPAGAIIALMMEYRRLDESCARFSEAAAHIGKVLIHAKEPAANEIGARIALSRVMKALGGGGRAS